MGSKDQGGGAASSGGGFFKSFAAGMRSWGTAVHKSVNGLLGYEGLEVINPEGGTDDAEEEALRGRWKQEDRDSYWKMMHKYIGSDVTSLVTLPVIIFEPMTMLQKMAELMEYCELLEKADQCEDPYMRMAYASTWAVSVYFAYQRTWKPFNPILGETYEMVNHQGITFLAEQVSHHPPMGVAHCENEHFTYDITSKIWRIAPAPQNDKYQYTHFAHKINSFDTAPKKLLASDSRLRPDRYALEKGDMSKSGAEKSRLEEQQRAEKRTREAKGEQFTPRWFNLTDVVAPTPWGELDVYEYNGKYTEHRAAIDSSSAADETDVTSIEFNPWQYSSSSS
nr:unnamed protein product [Digitaria exilis]